MSFKNVSGTCLCKAVRIQVEEVQPNVGACHCNMCRKWGGGPLLAVDCGTGVSISGEENVGRFQSSDWAERGFCKHCGTHLFYFLKPAGQYMIPAGLLGVESSLQFDHQIFIEEKPGFYDFANATHNMTGEEVFAAFAPPSED